MELTQTKVPMGQRVQREIFLNSGQFEMVEPVHVAFDSTGEVWRMKAVRRDGSYIYAGKSLGTFVERDVSDPEAFMNGDISY